MVGGSSFVMKLWATNQNYRALLFTIFQTFLNAIWRPRPKKSTHTQIIATLAAKALKARKSLFFLHNQTFWRKKKILYKKENINNPSVNRTCCVLFSIEDNEAAALFITKPNSHIEILGIYERRKNYHPSKCFDSHKIICRV